jgi:hypothetical protein
MAKFKFTPSPDYIFVKPDENVFYNIRFMPQSGETSKLIKGKIISVPSPLKTTLRGGRGKDMPTPIDERVTAKVGDIILYDPQSVYVFEIDDETYHLISNWNVKAKLT